MSNPEKPSSPLSDDQRKHLDYVQATVSRMAGASAMAKSWLLPVATATFAYAMSNTSWSIALLGMAAVLVFAALDAQYLRQERAFRALFRDVAGGSVTHYEMSVAKYHNKPNGDENDQRMENCRWDKVIWSWSLAGFYGPLLLVGVVISVWSRCQA